MKKAGITVVLVLVALTVVGVCIAAVRKTREAAARTQCTNNFKMIGLALHSYHDSHKRFPLAVSAMPNAARPPEKQLGWLSMILPYLEWAVMVPMVNTKKPWDDAENERVATWICPFYLCPTHPNHGEKYPFTHYVGITGVGKGAAWLPADDGNAGIFGYERTVTMNDITDGKSNTIMVAETGRDNGPFAKGGFTTARGIDKSEPDYLGPEGQFLSFHRSSTPFSFNSLTLVAMADGSVRTLSNRVSDDVLESLATYAGGEKNSAEDIDR